MAWGKVICLTGWGEPLFGGGGMANGCERVDGGIGSCCDCSRSSSGILENEIMEWIDRFWIDGRISFFD